MSAEMQVLRISTQGKPSAIIWDAIISHGGRSTAVKALWDTGATMTCVADYVLRRLDATSCGIAEITTPTGKKKTPLYRADLHLGGDVELKDHVVAEYNQPSDEHDMLVGMDIITMGRMVLSHYEGVTSFSFCVPSPGHDDFYNFVGQQDI